MGHENGSPVHGPRTVVVLGCNLVSPPLFDHDFSGGHSAGEIPVPIPNTEVKPGAPMVLGQRPGE